jgi:Uma2 family endonuclease
MLMARIAEPPVRTEQRLRMSYEEYLAYVDDSTHSEWVDGEVTIFMPPTLRHQMISSMLMFVLTGFLRFHRLGIVLHKPFEMKLRAGRSYREPDLLIILNENRARLTKHRLEGPADVLIELLSPESLGRDRIEKRQEYEAAGVREYWIIDATANRSGVISWAIGGEGRYHVLTADSSSRMCSQFLPGFFIDQSWFTAAGIPDEFDVISELIPVSFG